MSDAALKLKECISTSNIIRGLPSGIVKLPAGSPGNRDIQGKDIVIPAVLKHNKNIKGQCMTGFHFKVMGLRMKELCRTI